jgi:hypothetical protein
VLNPSPIASRDIFEDMPKLLDEINRLQKELPGMGEDEQRILKMFANILETYGGVRHPQNRFTVDEFIQLPGQWELIDGMLHSDGMPWLEDE